jgi:ADP-ribose pyrophosphatase YjhB (NUDIX family)
MGLYLHNSERTRVIVTYKNSVLLQRSLVSTQHWSLPGGGIAKKEDPRKAAARELHEETGIRIAPEKLTLVAVDRLPRGNRWPQYAVRFYHVSLQKKIEPKIIRPYEIIDVGWFGVDSLPKDTSETVHIGLKNAILNAPK